MKIGILGKSILELADAPWSDTSWQLWGLNYGYFMDEENFNPSIFPRFNKWFDLHSYENEPQDEKFKSYLRFLEKHDSIRQENYPIEGIVRHFNTEFFKNSIALMIAYALYKYPDLTDIGLWGIELHSPHSKYYDTEDCTLFWLGIAHERGIKIHTSINSKLYKNKETGIYAFNRTIL